MRAKEKDWVQNLWELVDSSKLDRGGYFKQKRTFNQAGYAEGGNVY